MNNVGDGSVSPEGFLEVGHTRRGQQVNNVGDGLCLTRRVLGGKAVCVSPFLEVGRSGRYFCEFVSQEFWDRILWVFGGRRIGCLWEVLCRIGCFGELEVVFV